MGDKITRREFLQKAGIVGVSTVGLALGGGTLFDLMEDEVEAAGKPFCIASGGNPAQLTKKAINAMGGIRKFVKKGDTVAIKPNLAWIRTPAEAANTDPGIISALIRMCKEAGASRVVVVDHTCDNAALSFNKSGARHACSTAGARLISADNQSMYKKIRIPKGKILKSDECIKEILNADVFINVPKAKVHSATAMSAGMKNMMGAVYERNKWHASRDLDQCIADFASAVRPDLIVLDATRILMTNGPKGPGEIKVAGQVVASTDPVAIDAYAAHLMGIAPKSVRHIAYASAMHLGQIDWKKLSVKKV